MIQTGYLTYENIFDEYVFIPEIQRIFLPNYELQRVWREFILQDVYAGKPQAFYSQ